ncbi:MAG TPA: glycoside hydrolase family 3 N-terminal domain-containing protein [Pyrinomonadaceae bacterium]|jgi:beta-N-acetylhexosaminidase
MKFLTYLLLIFSVILNLPVSTLPQTSAQTQNKKFRPSEKAQKWADKLLKKMSLDEKIGQLIHIGINAQYLSQDSNEYKELMRQVTENKIGGVVVFVGGVYETVHLINRMQENAKIPLLISADFETGVGMRFPDTVNFPWNMAIAATGNTEFARRQGEIVAREAKAMGVRQVFAPVVDVNNNADNPVINVRSYGENPQDVARFAVAFTEGLQSQNILATAKHFPGHGDTNVDSHRGLPIIDLPRSRLEAVELVPFKAVVNAGIGSVMVAHISLPQIDSTEAKPLNKAIAATDTDAEVITEAATLPSTLSPIVISQILKKEMNFDGLIVTDAMSMSGLTLYFNQDEAAVRAFLAGADVLLKPADTDLAIKGLKDAVQSGRITEARLDESVRKQLAWKYQLGLEKEKITPIDQIDTVVSSNPTRILTNEIAESAITLVKNDDNALPLAKDKKIFYLGITNGDDRSFSGNSFQRELRAAGYRFEAITLDDRSTEAEVRLALKKALESDIVVAGLFGRVRSGSKNSVGLPDAAADVLRKILQNDKKVISLSFGNPYLLKGFPEMKTYVVSYGDMSSLQRATAKAVTGSIDFKGKLPITVGDYPRGTGLSLKK